MSRKHSTLLFLPAFGLWLAACNPGAGGITAIPVTTSHGGPVRDYVSLIDNLQEAGATVEPAGEVEQPFFSVTGEIIRVNGANVQVFEYASEAEAAKDAAKVSPGGSPIGTTMVTWVSIPHFYRTGRLIVLYVGDEASVVTLLEDALGPQFAGSTPDKPVSPITAVPAPTATPPVPTSAKSPTRHPLSACINK